MGEDTKIGWTDHTHNTHWGCVEIGSGDSACDNCYARTLAERWGFEIWGKDAPRRMLSDANWAKPLKWNGQSEHDVMTGEGLGRRHRVFSSSMADVFENRRDLDEVRARLWDLIELTPWLDWQLLTKRPEQVNRMVPEHWVNHGWPPNIWLGTTIAHQRDANMRVPRVLETGALVHFLSYEPGLGAVDFDEAGAFDNGHENGLGWVEEPSIRWVIVGGESGGHARYMDPTWIRSAVEQCQSARVPVFVKQAGKLLGKEWGSPDAHGENWDTWPDWAKVRQFPPSPATLPGISWTAATP